MILHPTPAEALIHSIESFIRVVGKAASWLALGLVVLMSVNVLTRYALGIGMPWQQELVRFFHAMLFLLGAGYALQRGAHVRVDVLYQALSEKKRALIDLLGTVLLLWPLCAGMVYFSYGYVIASWEILEGSSEYRGMPGMFVLKSCIWACAALLTLSGLAWALRCILILRGTPARERIAPPEQGRRA